ncbi:hypothetical protein K439DRAFT_1163330 [Ramaria rubella]|nr:hypothetical protein K439DRAFT_1163330 [Ramaria rubella]
MHFLSAGRNDRIQRWIAEQYPHLKLENDASVLQDAVETVTRKMHEAGAEVDWELEELERQMALSAYACGREHWRTSMVSSVDSCKLCLDLVSVKRASILSAKVSEATAGESEVAREDEARSQPTPSTPNKRREGCAILQPPVLPADSDSETELPYPSQPRSRTVPPPITTTRPGRDSNASLSAPPIAFILQESASPLPSAIHFTQTPLDIDAFPTTPRSYNSFVPELPRSGGSQPDLFLSPRLERNDQAVSFSHQPLTTPSPSTPYSFYSSGGSTPSLSAFPATPGSLRPSLHRNGFVIPQSPAANSSRDPVPPVPPIYPRNRVDASSGLSLSSLKKKDLPSPPTPDSLRAPTPPPPTQDILSGPPSPPSSPCSVYAGIDESACSESEISVDGGLSGSVFSSRFSVSSGTSTYCKPPASRAWGALRARAGSTTRSRAGSTATSHAGTPSHARSESGMLQSAPIDELPRKQHMNNDLSPTQAQISPPPTASVRSLIKSVSRMGMGMGLRRSKSHGTQPKPKLSIRTHTPSPSMFTMVSKDNLHEQGSMPTSATMSMGESLTTPPGRSPPSLPLPPVPAARPATPETPDTPTSSMSSFFGMGHSPSLERRQRLVVKGVRRDVRCDDGVRRWCEGLGPVKYVGRVPGSEDILVHFRDDEAFEMSGRIETRRTIIPGVGSVTLNWIRGSTRGVH